MNLRRGTIRAIALLAVVGPVGIGPAGIGPVGIGPVGIGAVGIGSGPVSAAASPSPLANPSSNRAIPALANNTGPCTYGHGGAMSCLSPCYPTGALQYNSSKSCTNLLLAAINQAQVSEHLKGLTLPSNYFHLNVTRQLFVLVNLVRIARSAATGGAIPVPDRGRNPSRSAFRGSCLPDVVRACTRVAPTRRRDVRLRRGLGGRFRQRGCRSIRVVLRRRMGR